MLDYKLGKCHICEQQTLIAYCGICDHWFCKVCRKEWWPRGLAAVKEQVMGRVPGCCGPNEGE